jgi:hypothetical protein
VSIPTGLIVLDDDGPTVTADWFKLVATVSGMSTGDFDLARQEAFKNAVAASLVDPATGAHPVTPEGMVLLVEDVGGVAVIVHTALAVDATQASGIASTLSGAAFNATLTSTLAAHGITVDGKITAEQVADDSDDTRWVRSKCSQCSRGGEWAPSLASSKGGEWAPSAASVAAQVSGLQVQPV